MGHTLLTDHPLVDSIKHRCANGLARFADSLDRLVFYVMNTKVTLMNTTVTLMNTRVTLMNACLKAIVFLVLEELGFNRTDEEILGETRRHLGPKYSDEEILTAIRSNQAKTKSQGSVQDSTSFARKQRISSLF